MYRKILLASDGSEHSLRAASHAVELAKIDNSKVDVVYAVDGKTSKEDVLHGLDKYQVKKERELKIKPVVDKLKEANITCESHIIHGEPGPAIVSFANDYDYDIVIVGSRGKNKLQTMILGSVSHKIAKRVHCPVLIVK
ncbi:universal stress protein [Gracilibacillus salinarum]|uniref:Universal stress protein n=1 Tax=Gracilibacillus salinarum TaxID=2932255 RepID=A0ABY4GQC4_9BACI|nr:universal stress protein [Gracilibacillus salinarum]UOQ86386.1 universal stress protein [Gracilibacillus salinarum]